MAKDLPWYKVYPEDGEDERMKRLSLSQRGLLSKALDYAWVHGGLPADPRETAKALGVESRHFPGIFQEISWNFPLAEDGRLRNPRQQEQLAEIQAKSQTRKASAERRWHPEKPQERMQMHDPGHANGSIRASVSIYSNTSEECNGREDCKTGEEEEFVLTSESASQKKSRPKKSPSPLELLAAQFAPAIQGRHVYRKCSLKSTEKLLMRILQHHPPPEREAVIRRIDKNHAQLCESYEWTKEGGQFCPGLEAWLNPDKERYFIVEKAGLKPYPSQREQQDIDRRNRIASLSKIIADVRL